jgi:hypothetical protein
MVYRYAKRNDEVRNPEARLDAIWLAFLLPIGVIICGVCMTQHETVSWVGAVFRMEIACLGLQAATTVVYAYTTEVSPQFFSRYYLTYGMKTDMIQCYKP